MALPLLPMLLLAGGAIMVLGKRGGGGGTSSLSAVAAGHLAPGELPSDDPMEGTVSGQNGPWKWKITSTQARPVGGGAPTGPKRWFFQVGPMAKTSGGGYIWQPDPIMEADNEQHARAAGFFKAQLMANSRPADVGRVPLPPPPAAAVPAAPPMSTPIADLYNGAFAAQGESLTSGPSAGKWMGWGSNIRDEYSKMHHVWSYPVNSKSRDAFIGMNRPEQVLAWQAFALTSHRFSDAKVWATIKRNAKMPELVDLIGSGTSTTKPLEIFNKVKIMVVNLGQAIGSGIEAVASIMTGNVLPSVQFVVDVKNTAESILEPAKDWRNEALQRKELAAAIISRELQDFIWELALWNPWLVNKSTGKIDLSYRYKCDPQTLGDLFATGGTCPPWIFIPSGLSISVHGLTPLGQQIT